MVLITSSISAGWPGSPAKQGSSAVSRCFTALTILLAVSFLGRRRSEYRDKLTHYWVETKGGQNTLTGHLVEKTDKEIVLHGVKTDDAKASLRLHDADYKSSRLTKSRSRPSGHQADQQLPAEAEHLPQPLLDHHRPPARPCNLIGGILGSSPTSRGPAARCETSRERFTNRVLH